MGELSALMRISEITSSAYELDYEIEMELSLTCVLSCDSFCTILHDVPGLNQTTNLIQNLIRHPIVTSI